MNQAAVIRDIARAAPTVAECIQALRELSRAIGQWGGSFNEDKS